MSDGRMRDHGSPPCDAPAKPTALPARYVTEEDAAARRAVHVVWELTLACNLRCGHCGSRAGRPRLDELSLAECLAVVAQLPVLGTRDVTLIGGEAFLRRDWLDIVRAICDAGMTCTLQTGGFGLTAARIEAAHAAGLAGIGVSLDGLPATHDALRGVRGSFVAAVEALRSAAACGLRTSVNTTLTTAVRPELQALLDQIAETGARHWQLQLAVPMGRAADRPELLLQPWELLSLMPELAALYWRGVDVGVLLQAGNNLGYFGPYEHLLRGSGDARVHYTGCGAGEASLGIEADGTLKGCPSLPTRAYAAGNVRVTPLRDLWAAPALSVAQSREPQELWGYCAGCYYRNVCVGGCSWMAHTLLGRRGNNPYCHHRVLELAHAGLREYVVQVESASDQPFDFGRFALTLERTHTHDDAAPQPAYPPPQHEQLPGRPRSIPPLVLPCAACHRHVRPSAVTCPFCDADLAAARDAADAALAEAAGHAARLSTLLTVIGE